MSTLPSAPRSATSPGTRRPTINHYMPKAAILDGIVNGTMAVALCGLQFVPEARGEGQTAVPGAVICSACAAVYESLPG